MPEFGPRFIDFRRGDETGQSLPAQKMRFSMTEIVNIEAKPQLTQIVAGELGGESPANSGSLQGEYSSLIQEGEEGSADPYVHYNYTSLYSISFRNWFLERFNLSDKDGNIYGENLSLLKMAAFLLPGGHTTRNDTTTDKEYIIVSQPVLCQVVRGYQDHNFKASKHLDQFKERMWDLDILAHDRFRNLARRVTDQHFPQELVRRLKEMFNDPSSMTIDLVTGNGPNPKSTNSNLPQSPIAEIKKIQDGLNGIDIVVFDPIKSRIEDARSIINNSKWKEAEKVQQLAVVAQIERDPKPHYQAVPKTTRLYAIGLNWLGMKREIRAILTSGYWQIDIKSAQLCISAALWDWPIEKYISNESAWDHLRHELGARNTNEQLKNQLKTFMYSLLFGATTHTLAQKANDMGHTQLMMLPMVKDVLAARDRANNNLRQKRSLRDAWGSKREIKHGKGENSEPSQIRSILCTTCQSYELALLKPVFDYAEQHDLQIVALNHDGVYLAGDWETHIAKVRDLVREKGQELLNANIEIDVTPPTNVSKESL